MSAVPLQEVQPDSGYPWCASQTFIWPSDCNQHRRHFHNCTDQSVSDAVEKLNAGTIECSAGICLVTIEPTDEVYVVFRKDKRQEAFGRFVTSGAAARIVATKAIVSETWYILPIVVGLYRFTEFNAQVLLLCFMTWLVNPWLLAFLCAALWYYPTVRRTGGFGKPLGYPLMNFCVHDFSFLDLNPGQIRPWAACRWALLRTCVMLALIPLLLPDISPLPDELRDMLSNTPALDKLSWMIRHVKPADELSGYIEMAWAIVAALVLMMSVFWLLATIPMMMLEKCIECMGIGESTLERRKMLATEIQCISWEEPAKCRQKLERLQAIHPSLKLTSAVNVLGPAWAVLLHLGIDLLNIVSFTLTDDSWRAALLAFVVLITLCAANNDTSGGFFSIWHEVKTSWDRGLHTDDYLTFVKADKGIQAIPSLIIIVSGLPFKAKDIFSTVSGAASMIINVALCVPFIYEQCDLGVEAEGWNRQPSESLDGEPSVHES